MAAGMADRGSQPGQVLFEDQAGVASREQLRAAGITDRMLAVRVRSGRWQRLHTGVYATFSGPVTPLARWWAALLVAGDGAMLSHHTAAEAAGLLSPGSNGTAVHVTVPARRKVARTPGVVVHRSHRADQLVHPARRPPQTRVEETVLDLTQDATTLDDAIGWLALACGTRLTTPARLSQVLAGRSRVRWRRELAAALVDVAAGCHSLLEVRYLRQVERRHQLPEGARQQARARRGGRWYDDVHYRAYATIVELDGRAAHPDEARWRDMHRDNAAVATGRSVLRYGLAAVSQRPCQVAVQVATVLLRNGWPGPPRPCSPTCPVALIVEPSVPIPVEDLPR